MDIKWGKTFLYNLSIVVVNKMIIKPIKDENSTVGRSSLTVDARMESSLLKFIIFVGIWSAS